MLSRVALKPLALLCAFGFSMVLTGCDDQPQKTAASQHAPEVKVVSVRTVPLQVTADLPGRTSAFRVAEIRPQVTGIVLKRTFTEGSEVKAGQPLYQIDPAPFQAAFARAQANVAQALADERIAQVTLSRYQSLIPKQYVSRQDYDEAVATAEQAHANVQSAKAACEAARINLAWSTVTSPIEGRAGLSSVTEGALVQDGQENALTRVQQLNPIYVDVTQSSDDFLRLQQALTSGQLRQKDRKAIVQVLLQDGSQYPLSGTLAFSDVSVDHTTGSLTLRAIVPNPHHQLLPGMFVRARLQEGIDPQAMLIPQQAVTRTPRGDATVMIVNAQNQVENREVTAAQAIGDKWLITSGLQNGDKVIVSGLQKVRPGVTVKATEDTAAPVAQ